MDCMRDQRARETRSREGAVRARHRWGGRRRALLASMLLFAADPLTPSAAFAASAPYWVFFRDRGTAAEQGVARQRRLDDVTARARQRRLRAHPGVIVRASDLPPCARYQAAVEATGARVRTRSHWLNALSVSATPRQVARIASLPFVARVRRVAGRARPSGAVRDGDAAGRPVGLATQVAAARLPWIRTQVDSARFDFARCRQRRAYPINGGMMIPS